LFGGVMATTKPMDSRSVSLMEAGQSALMWALR
jgi:hypothetical protein